MSRDVPFKADAICDSCGRPGAFDFMGDYICTACMKKDMGEDNATSALLPHDGKGGAA